MTDTGSALLDEIITKRRRLDKLFRRPAPTPPARVRVPIKLPWGTKLPMLRVEPEKPVAERAAEARKLRGKISEMELHSIISAIYGSARDYGDNSFDEITLDEQKVPVDMPIVNIQRTVADYFNLTITEMLSLSRRRGSVNPRQIAMYLARQLPRNLSEIGRQFGGRDHATVSHAVQKVNGLVAKDASFAEEVEALKTLVLG